MTPQRYAAPQIAIHWFTVALFIALYATMLVREDMPREDPMRATLAGLHISLGLLSALIVAVRLAARVWLPQPPVEDMGPWLRLAAAAGHLGLYLLLIGLPLTGLLFTTLNGRPPAFFGLQLPALLAENKPLARTIKEIHESLANVGYALIALHAAAALWHHYVRKDGVLARMLPLGAKPGLR